MLGFINLLALAPTVVGNVVVTDTLTIAKNEQAKITSVKSATSIYGQGTEYQNFDAGSAVCNATVGAATTAGGAAIGSIIPVAGTIVGAIIGGITGAIVGEAACNNKNNSSSGGSTSSGYDYLTGTYHYSSFDQKAQRCSSGYGLGC